jgi:hypothetical protein
VTETDKLIIYYGNIYDRKKVLQYKPLVSFSQHFIFFESYKWAQTAGVFIPGKTILA